MRQAAFTPIGAAPTVLVGAGWERFSQSNLKFWMLGFNFLGLVAHAIGVGLTLGLGRQDIRLRAFRTVPVNNGNDTHPVLSRGVELDMAFYPTWIVAVFFMLSMAFHLFVVIWLLLHLVFPQNKYFSLYMRCLYLNIALWRWAEYFFSASLMVMLTCVLLGIRDIHSIVMITGLMAITIVFGWLTEVHSMNHIVDVQDKPYKIGKWQLERRWKSGSWITRMQPHLLGYLPYALLWAIIFDQYRANMEVVSDSLPDFVNIAVIGSFSLFTIFGLTQLILQLFPYGPSVYWLGEMTYVVLSFAAKAQLGFIVLFQALVEGGLYDNVLVLTRDA